MNQSQWAQVRTRSSAADPRQPRQRPLQARVGQAADADHAVDDDRIAGAQPRPQALGVVVGELVDDGEGPHLHREEGDVAPLRARLQHGQRQRARGAGGDRHRRRDPQAAAQQRHRDGGADRADGAGPHRQAKRFGWPGAPPHQVGEYRSEARRRPGGRGAASPE